MKNTFLFLSSLVFSLFLAELSIRVFEFRVIPGIQPLQRNETIMHDPDDALGWTLRPGRYTWKKPAPGVDDLIFTIGDDRLRTTGPKRSETLPGMAVIGGSTIFGYGLSDEQTFSWKLQERLGNFQVFNLGVVAYGTYQSWLALRRQIEKYEKNLSVVLYGFIDDHERRNVADYSWQKSMYFVNTVRNEGALTFPFIKLADDGTPVPQAPETYSLSPFSDISFLWQLVEDSAQKLTKYRMHTSEETTMGLLRHMSAYLKKRNIRFIVLYIDEKEKKFSRYSDFFAKNNIDFLDIRASRSDYNKWRLSFDRYNHVGEKAQEFWLGKVMSSGILEVRGSP